MVGQRGLTLIELLVTLAVAGILLVVGVPSFVDFVVSNRLVTYTNEFVATLAYARSEAIKRGTTVSVCKSSSGTSCTGNWSNGWIVFIDNKTGGTQGAVDSGEKVLRVHNDLSSGYTLNANTNFKNYVSFQADGSSNQSGTFVFCNDGDTSTARTAILTRLRVRVDTGAADCVDP